MNDITEKLLDRAFLYLQPWFYNNKLALRCELGIGQGKEYMDNAVGRALKIANILFQDKKIDAAFYNQYFYNDGQVFEEGDFKLNIDKVVDLDIDLLHSLDQIDEDVAAVKRYISYDVSFTALENILKNQIDNQFNPLVSFVSFDNQFIFSVYDDRGCDIVFFDDEKYKEFYLKLEPYLLDYDREMMRKTFVSIYNATSENSVVKCDECGSKYIAAKSQMMYLCPECSHVLYGYENCNHKFKDGRCELCLWDGSRSDYIKELINK